jgi:hypothetical protein
MTTARIVFYDPQSRTYHLPHEHAAWLVEGAGPDNLARIMRFLPQLVEVEQGIIRCFREGGGLSYADYPRFHAVMGEDSAAVVDATLLDRTVPLVEGLDARLRAGVDVADIGRLRSGSDGRSRMRLPSTSTRFILPCCPASQRHSPYSSPRSLREAPRSSARGWLWNCSSWSRR